MSDMPKTLYIILNHNVKTLTTTYYEELKYYQEQDNFKLLLIDNGSKIKIEAIILLISLKKICILMVPFSGHLSKW